jgi:hypothetical protein
LFPRTRNIIFVIDSLDWAYWLAGAAIHTLIGLDVEHATALVDAIYWALFDARLIFDINARFGDYVGHLIPLELVKLTEADSRS